MTASLTQRSPDHQITGSPDLAPSPDLFSDPTPLLRDVQETERRYREVKQQLPEIERQFLEAKRRYRLFQEIVLLRRELFIRRFKRLEDLARVRTVLRQQEGGQVQQNDPEADAERSRLAQNLKESFLKLEKIRELIRDGENLLHRQQRALKRRRKASAAQILPGPEMRDNALRLQKLKELFRLRQELVRRQERALRQHDAAAGVQQVQNHDGDNCDASALPEQPREPRGERRSARTRGEGAAACGGALEDNAEPQPAPIPVEQPPEAQPVTPAPSVTGNQTASTREVPRNLACRKTVWIRNERKRSAGRQSASAQHRIRSPAALLITRWPDGPITRSPY